MSFVLLSRLLALTFALSTAHAQEIEEAPGPWPQPEAPEVAPPPPPPPLDTRAARSMKVRAGAPPRHAVPWSIAQTPRSGCAFVPAGMNCLVNPDDVGLDSLPAHVHANVGLNQPLGGSVITAWGLALEVPAGPLTPQVEVFGADAAEPTLQFGVLGRPLPDLTLDGKVGRTDGVNRYSVGLRLRF